MEMHICKLCVRSYTGKGFLRNHMTRVHGGALTSNNAAGDHHVTAHAISTIYDVLYDHLLMTSPIPFTSDAVCHDVFKFFITFRDGNTEIFSATEKLQVRLSALITEYRLCVQYVCDHNLTPDQCREYYEHIVQRDELLRTSLHSKLTKNFSSVRAFQQYCDIVKKVAVLEARWKCVAISLPLCATT